VEQVFFIADFHLGDHDVFTKDESREEDECQCSQRDNWLLDMWMSQVGKKDCVYILGDLMAYRGEAGCQARNT
jgi:calcineurin-like phosphoesterase family protein